MANIKIDTTIINKLNYKELVLYFRAISKLHETHQVKETGIPIVDVLLRDYVNAYNLSLKRSMAGKKGMDARWSKPKCSHIIGFMVVEH